MKTIITTNVRSSISSNITTNQKVQRVNSSSNTSSVTSNSNKRAKSTQILCFQKSKKNLLKSLKLKTVVYYFVTFT